MSATLPQQTDQATNVIVLQRVPRKSNIPLPKISSSSPLPVDSPVKCAGAPLVFEIADYQQPSFKMLVLSNPSKNAADFKIMISETAYGYYDIEPYKGIIPPNSSIPIKVTLYPSQELRHSNDFHQMRVKARFTLEGVEHPSAAKFVDSFEMYLALHVKLQQPPLTPPTFSASQSSTPILKHRLSLDAKRHSSSDSGFKSPQRRVHIITTPCLHAAGELLGQLEDENAVLKAKVRCYEAIYPMAVASEKYLPGVWFLAIIVVIMAIAYWYKATFGDWLQEGANVVQTWFL